MQCWRRDKADSVGHTKSASSVFQSICTTTLGRGVAVKGRSRLAGARSAALEGSAATKHHRQHVWQQPLPARSVRLRRRLHATSIVGSPYQSADTALLGPGPFFDCGTAAAEPQIRSPRIAAGTKIPHTRGHRARKGGTNLYRGILQPGRYAVRPPRSGKGQRPSRMAGYSVTSRAASGRFQHRTLRHFSVCHVAPERDQQLARERDNGDPPYPPTHSANPCAEPTAQCTVRLMPHVAGKALASECRGALQGSRVRFFQRPTEKTEA